MVLGIFIGGIFLGFSLGFAIMALVAARGLRFQSEEAQAIEDYPACAYSPIRKFSPVAGGQATGLRSLVYPRALKGEGAHAWAPGLDGKSRLHRPSLALNAAPPRQD